MKVNQGKIHDYLGMTLNYSVKGQVNIIMLDYIKEIGNAFKKQNQNPVALNQL